MCTPLEATVRMSGVFASEWAEERWENARLVAFHSSHPRDPTALLAEAALADDVHLPIASKGPNSSRREHQEVWGVRDGEVQSSIN